MSAAIAALMQADYTVHAPSAEEDPPRWALCLDGDYIDDFGSEAEAWKAAATDFAANHSAESGCQQRLKTDTVLALAAI